MSSPIGGNSNGKLRSLLESTQALKDNEIVVVDTRTGLFGKASKKYAFSKVGCRSDKGTIQTAIKQAVAEESGSLTYSEKRDLAKAIKKLERIFDEKIFFIRTKKADTFKHEIRILENAGLDDDLLSFPVAPSESDLQQKQSRSSSIISAPVEVPSIESPRPVEVSKDAAASLTPIENLEAAVGEVEAMGKRGLLYVSGAGQFKSGKSDEHSQYFEANHGFSADKEVVSQALREVLTDKKIDVATRNSLESRLEHLHTINSAIPSPKEFLNGGKKTLGFISRLWNKMFPKDQGKSQVVAETPSVAPMPVQISPAPVATPIVTKSPEEKLKEQLKLKWNLSEFDIAEYERSGGKLENTSKFEQFARSQIQARRQLAKKLGIAEITLSKTQIERDSQSFNPALNIAIERAIENYRNANPDVDQQGMRQDLREACLGARTFSQAASLIIDRIVSGLKEDYRKVALDEFKRNSSILRSSNDMSAIIDIAFAEAQDKQDTAFGPLFDPRIPLKVKELATAAAEKANAEAAKAARLAREAPANERARIQIQTGRLGPLASNSFIMPRSSSILVSAVPGRKLSSASTESAASSRTSSPTSVLGSSPSSANGSSISTATTQSSSQASSPRPSSSSSQSPSRSESPESISPYQQREEERANRVAQRLGIDLKILSVGIFDSHTKKIAPAFVDAIHKLVAGLSESVPELNGLEEDLLSLCKEHRGTADILEVIEKEIQDSLNHQYMVRASAKYLQYMKVKGIPLQELNMNVIVRHSVTQACGSANLQNLSFIDSNKHIVSRIDSSVEKTLDEVAKQLAKNEETKKAKVRSQAGRTRFW